MTLKSLFGDVFYVEPWWMQILKALCIFLVVFNFVPITLMPRLCASITSPRPTMTGDWKCTTSGFTSSSTLALFCLMRHGRAKRSQGCGGQRQLCSRCMIIR